MRILVTGGAGYIGSHTVLQLLDQDHDVTVVDDYSNSDPVALDRVRQITGGEVVAEVVDLCDAASLTRAVTTARPEAVIHFAGLKSVGESVAEPARYYRNNIVGTLNLLDAMVAAGCFTVVFSSSATVYGVPESVPISEDAPTSATNPYGWTKLMIEQILTDVAAADEQWRVALLRYFNPVGAHPSGLIGEDPKGIPNNLMPFIAQVAIGKREQINVMGNEYATRDGTGVRDYIHVDDLAAGHLAALDKIMVTSGRHVWNLGTGTGSSVLEVIGAYSQACGRELPYRIQPPRPGDVAESFADPSKAKAQLGWTAAKTLQDMCADSWRWQQANPNGYR
jgi:UDP-glucose 4-epimerase